MDNPTLLCPSCNASCIPGDRFCAECGSRLEVPTARTSQSCSCGSCEFTPEGFCVACGMLKRKDRGQVDELECGPRLAAVTNAGLKHARNDDAFDLSGDGGPGSIIVVCDGVSNSQNPDIGSVAGAKAAKAKYLELIASGVDTKLAVKQAIVAAHNAVCSVPFDRTADVDPPAATIVVAAITESEPGKVKVTAGWLGDSRIFWLSRGGGRQLTRDHSWMNEVIDSGKMTEEMAKKDRRAHAITACLGSMDMEATTPCIEPSVEVFDLPSEGCILACTDGLWNYAETASSIAIAANGSLSVGSSLEACRKLVNYARSRGGHDNITVAIAKLS